MVAFLFITIRALYRGGFGNNELHYYLTNLVTGERVEVCRGQAVTDYLKVCRYIQILSHAT